MNKEEQKFYESLQNIFVGVKIDGQGGYVNLMRIKEKYYSKVIENFKNEIDNDNIITNQFREEFFNKLYNFFNRYFNDCGSIYYSKTLYNDKIYEKVYKDKEDVTLFWKTNMLYYVKSDVLYKNIDVKVKLTEDEKYTTFRFLTENLIIKKTNEKKELVFKFSKILKEKGNKESLPEVFVFDVEYKEGNKKYDYDKIAKDNSINSELLQKAMLMFKKQSKVDYFINKDAKYFLNEQLDLYIHKILLDENNEFDENRLQQYKKIKEYAKKLIDFISQFENELKYIWNKPKFVLNSNYVISCKTLKSLISDSDFNKFINNYYKDIVSNDACRLDVEEIIRETYKRPLQKLYVANFKYEKNSINFSYYKLFNNDENDFDKAMDEAKKYIKGKKCKIYKNTILDKGEPLQGVLAEYDNNVVYKSSINIDNIYVDTKFISKDLKMYLIDILSKNDKFDELIDGYIIKTDSYQFLNSAKKFENRINCVYIDPPFNTVTEGFSFIDDFKDSTWLSLFYDRIELIYNKFLAKNSSLYVHGDHHCNYFMREVLNEICGKENFNREIIWNTSPAISGRKAGPKVKNYIRQHDTILYYVKGTPIFNKLYREYKNEIKIKELGWLDLYCDEKNKPYIMKYNNSKFEKNYFNDIDIMPLGDVWNDVYSMMYTQNMTRENWSKTNTQKPENLIRRFIQASTKQNDTVADFFVGSGTTCATAHKLGRKWIGIDIGEYVESIVIQRMKSVVMGDIRPKLSEDLNWEGGGIFKYYDLEQYEDTLSKMTYEENSTIYNDDYCNQYVFFADNKLSSCISCDNKKLNFNFNKLYENIDWPETLSLLCGKPIKKITKNEVLLYDMKPIKYNFDEMNDTEKREFIEIIKPLIWWGK